MAVISRIESIGGEQAVGAGEEPYRWAKANTHKWQCCAGDPNWHNSLGRPGLPLKSVWHPMQSY